MSSRRLIHVCVAPCFSVTANVALAMVLIAATPMAALAIDCSTWGSVQGEERDRALEEAIDELLGSPKADQWTTINKPRIKDCVIANRGRIQADFDGLCAGGMQTSLEALDDKLYEYAIGCTRA